MYFYAEERHPTLLWGAHWRHLANTIEPSVCGGDAVLCQITLTVHLLSLSAYHAAHTVSGLCNSVCKLILLVQAVHDDNDTILSGRIAVLRRPIPPTSMRPIVADRVCLVPSAYQVFTRNIRN